MQTGRQQPRRAYRTDKQAEVLLLANQDEPDTLNTTRAFAKTERERGATVHVLTYTAVKPVKGAPPDNSLWTPADMQYSGLPKAEREAYWRQREYDLVIHCSLVPFAPFDYLVAGLTAHRRIAAYDQALDSYDLVVAPPSGAGLADFLQQVKRYLSVLSPDYA